MKKSGISFATANRWKKAHCDPSQSTVNAIKNLRAEHDIDFSQMKGASIITSNETVTLYHGSKSGLPGSIAPSRRNLCDFSRDFYMDTERM